MMALLRTRLKRLWRSRLGTLFTVVLVISCGLFVLNYYHSPIAKALSWHHDNRVEREGGSRKLSEFEPNLQDWVGASSEAEGGGGKKVGKWKKRVHKSGQEAQVCTVPVLTLETDTNKDQYHSMPPLNCTQPELFYLDRQGDAANILRLNHTVLAGRQLDKCQYYGIEWMDDHYATLTTTISRTSQQGFEIVVKQDFFGVQCFLAKKETPDESRSGGRRLLAMEETKQEVVEEEGEDVAVEQDLSVIGSVGLPDPIARSPHNKHKHGRNSKSKKPDPRRGQSDTPNGRSLLEEPQHQYDTIEFQQQQVWGAGGWDDENTPPPGDQDLNYDDYSFFDSDEVDFDQMLAQVHPRDDVKSRSRRLQSRVSPHATQLNVLMFALDSMAHLGYQRKLPNTYQYLKETFGSVILNAYNIVGDATTAAMLPILTGKTETEHPEIRKGKEGSRYVDALPFIWNKFEQNGYVTMYAEDQPSLGTFQLRFNGFEQPPVDHYMRPFWLGVANAAVHDSSPQYCIGGKAEHQYLLEYMTDFFDKYRDFPKFAFGFIGELSHANSNPAEYIDNDLVKFLEGLRKRGALNNTLVVVMGDHGPRFSKTRRTIQGKLEERLPFMSLGFPESFTQKHPDLIKNLKANADSLATPFDLHETYQSVLDIRRARAPLQPGQRGISLLHPIPLNRTCLSAGIPLHWCTCLKEVQLDVGETRVQKVAHFLVEHLNQLTEQYTDRCERLQLSKLHTASMVFPNEKVLKYLRSIDGDQRIANFSRTARMDVLSFQVVFETAPNEGLYEATVNVESASGQCHIVGEVSRINRYGSQPACILQSSPDLRKYCYCRQGQPSEENTGQTGVRRKPRKRDQEKPDRRDKRDKAE